MTFNTTELTSIPAATITGTDGNTYTLELRPEVSGDYGLRYGIFNAATGEGTETSGQWFGAETYSEDDNELHLSEEIRAQAEASALEVLSVAWSAPEWNLTSLN